MIKAILIAFIVAIAGKVGAQTTQEEYNYVTKGYKVQLESGLDMKKDYELRDIDNVKQSGTNGTIARQAWLKALNRVSTNGTKTIAAYMIIYQRTGNLQQYFCIPSPNSSQGIIDAYFISLATELLGSTEKLQLITFLLSRSLKWQ